MVNILEEFGAKETINHPQALEVGHYRTYAVYPGLAQSEAVNFKVVYPVGEESTARDLYVSAFIKHISGRPQEAVADAQKLVTDFPKSVYAPASCDVIQPVYDIITPNGELAEEWGIYIVRNYPLSGFALRNQSYLISRFGKEEGAKRLSDIVEEHPESLRLRLGTRAFRRY